MCVHAWVQMHICASSWPPACVCVSRVTFVSPLCVLQTKSEAAVELEKFRKASEDKSSPGYPSSPSPPSFTCTSPPVCTPPPPPPAPLLAPPPPPLVLPKGKPSSVTNPSANALVDPALAREAMLEAIRSGSAAERLKKVQTQKTDSIFSQPRVCLVAFDSPYASLKQRRPIQSEYIKGNSHPNFHLLDPCGHIHTKLKKQDMKQSCNEHC